LKTGSGAQMCRCPFLFAFVLQAVSEIPYQALNFLVDTRPGGSHEVDLL